MRSYTTTSALSWLVAIAAAILPLDPARIIPDPITTVTDNGEEASRSPPLGFEVVSHGDQVRHALSTGQCKNDGQRFVKRAGHICGPVCSASRSLTRKPTTDPSLQPTAPNIGDCAQVIRDFEAQGRETVAQVDERTCLVRRSGACEGRYCARQHPVSATYGWIADTLNDPLFAYCVWYAQDGYAYDCYDAEDDCSTWGVYLAKV